ncbi:MAG: helix-turn-helix transcriptional regulator [Clostridia bacterium]|nr:helix-turn-helix transcriptional regulator [Clostridia bacterium]
MNKFAERLKELREEKNLTQNELGIEVGVSQAAIARWEEGKRSPNLEAIIALAKFFDVTSDYLIGIED